MRLVQASLAAVGAFWSELIPAPSPAPSLWDYEGAALAEAEESVEVWEAPRCPAWGSDCKCDRTPDGCRALHDPAGLLGREPSHADYDDEPRYTLKELFDIRTDKWNQDDERPGHGNGNDAGDGAELSSGAPVASTGAGVWNPPRDPAPSVAVTVPAVAADPAGVCTDPPVLVPPAGLPFTFDVDELIDGAGAIIYNHYFDRADGIARASHLARSAAEVVVSQLVADLTAAYTAAAERAAADSRINRSLTAAGFETGQAMAASMFPMHRKPQK